MTDKIVTRDDLPVLRDLRRAGHDGEPEAALLDRLIAAAEADQPPLPEGWVLLRLADNSQRVLWHHDGRLSVLRTQTGLWGDWFGDAEAKRDRLTPLRPTVTEADVERVASERWREVDSPGSLAYQQKVTYDVVKRLGIEVTR